MEPQSLCGLGAPGEGEEDRGWQAAGHHQEPSGGGSLVTGITLGSESEPLSVGLLKYLKLGALRIEMRVQPLAPLTSGRPWGQVVRWM